MTQPPPPAAWYPDPQDAQQRRYWDGAAWTEHTAPLAPPAPDAQQPQPALSPDNSVLPAPSRVQPAASPRFTLPRALWIALGASAVTVIGTLLPWVSVAIFSANGTSTGDGKLVLVLALLAAGSIAGTPKQPKLDIVAAVLGLAAFAVCLYDVIHIYASDHADFLGTSISASPGSGLWLDLIASAVLVAAVVKGRRTDR